MTLKRRDFLKAMGLGTAMVAVPGIVLSNTSARIVIVGGGTGGASVAKYLKRADATLDITLIEPDAIYHTCYGSNEVLSGTRPLGGIQVNYTGLIGHGIHVVQDYVIAIDPVAKRVDTNSAGYEYDFCVVSPGIDFKWESIEGYDANVAESIPHAWQAGDQTTTLRQQLQAMPNGGTVIVAPPANPFRCPPGPYERISQIAMYLKREKPNSKVLVLDAKTAFAKQAAFELGWERLYGYGSDNSMIEWLPDDPVVAIDPASNSVTTRNGLSFQGDVINLIPNQKAGAIAFTADLTEGDWCPVQRRDMQSTRHSGVYVLGDSASASSLPKSGFAANAEAKACAAAIVATIRGEQLPSPAYTNTCYSIVGEDYGISVIATYRLADDGSAIVKQAGGGVTPLDASAADLLRERDYAHSWYLNFVGDVFG